MLNILFLFCQLYINHTIFILLYMISYKCDIIILLITFFISSKHLAFTKRTQHLAHLFYSLEKNVKFVRHARMKERNLSHRAMRCSRYFHGIGNFRSRDEFHYSTRNCCTRQRNFACMTTRVIHERIYNSNGG